MTYVEYTHLGGFNGMSEDDNAFSLCPNTCFERYCLAVLVRSDSIVARAKHIEGNFAISKLKRPHLHIWCT